MNKGYIAVMAVALILVVALVSVTAGITIGKYQARREMFREAHKRWEMRGEKMNAGDIVSGMRRAERGKRFHEFAEKNPEEMQKMMDARKEKVRERLIALKRDDPEKFKQVMKKMDMLERNLESLKRELAAEPVK